MSSIGAAAAGAASSGAMGIIGSLVNYGLNKKLAAQQNQYNIDMWKMQAEYNSPQAQMQRFSEAGLNPNLIYGQGNNGNMSNAPQMVTPNAPELSESMRKMGEAFNIENLRTLVANRKKAQADAENAQTNATRNARQLFAEANFRNHYYFDLESGSWVPTPADSELTRTVYHPSAYYHHKMLADAYRSTHLIPYRAALLDWQKHYLVPQVLMAQYEQSHYPVSYWIGQGSKVFNGLTSIPATFSPLKWKFKPSH